MKTLLRRDGEKFILELGRETIEDWGIDPAVPLEVVTRGGAMILSPAESPKAGGKIDAILHDLMDRYDESLKKMAE